MRYRRYTTQKSTFRHRYTSKTELEICPIGDASPQMVRGWGNGGEVETIRAVNSRQRSDAPASPMCPAEVASERIRRTPPQAPSFSSPGRRSART
jgi:hypothetical protein